MRGLALRWGLMGMAVLLLSVLRCGAVTGYSVFQIDEESVVSLALGFFDGDLNPHWFDYHTLPIYLVAGVYAVIYGCMHLFGQVPSVDAFAALLFSNDAVFYVSAKLLCAFAYTAGCATLAWIVWRRWRAGGAALALFAVTFVLPDALVASDQIKAEAFVLLFMAGLLWFGFLAPRTGPNMLIGAVLLAAAVDSKVPAVTLIPVFAAQVAVDLWGRRYSWKWAAGIAGMFLAALVVFMPYAFIDFDTYRGTLERMGERAVGELQHLGKEERTGLLPKGTRIVAELANGAGTAPLVLCVALAALALWRRRELLLPLALPAAYATAFITSRTLDGYWLRPVFPFVAFFGTVLLLEAAATPWAAERIRRLAGTRGWSPGRLTGVAVAALVVLTCLLPFGGNLPQAFAALRSQPEDTRVVAARWIRENLPPGSGIVLDGTIPHYHPVIPATDPRVHLENLGYPWPMAEKPLYGRAYRDYYMRSVAPGPVWQVGILPAEAGGFDLSKLTFRAGVYVVLSSSYYKRFFLPQTDRSHPELAAAARRYYGFIRSQQPVMQFSGRGPTIEIWRITGSVPAPLRP